MAGKFASGEGKGFLIVLAAFVFVFALLLPLIAMIYVETKVTDKVAQAALIDNKRLRKEIDEMLRELREARKEKEKGHD
jgi:uncharacterized membrane protein (DUF106 family)